MFPAILVRVLAPLLTDDGVCTIGQSIVEQHLAGAGHAHASNLHSHAGAWCLHLAHVIAGRPPDHLLETCTEKHWRPQRDMACCRSGLEHVPVSIQRWPHKMSSLTLVVTSITFSITLLSLPLPSQSKCQRPLSSGSSNHGHSDTHQARGFEVESNSPDHHSRQSVISSAHRSR